MDLGPSEQEVAAGEISAAASRLSDGRHPLECPVAGCRSIASTPADHVRHLFRRHGIAIEGMTRFERHGAAA